MRQLSLDDLVVGGVGVIVVVVVVVPTVIQVFVDFILVVFENGIGRMSSALVSGWYLC